MLKVLRDSYKRAKQHKEAVAAGLMVIPIVRWIAGAILLDEAAKLGRQITDIDSKIEDLLRDINLQETYSSKFDQLEARHKELAAALQKLDRQLELSGQFKGSFIDQRSFWRAVSLSYQEIKMKVMFCQIYAYSFVEQNNKERHKAKVI